MIDLRSVLISDDARPFRALISLFVQTAMTHERDMFFLYLVLVLDEPNMIKYVNLTAAERIQKPYVYKMLYAGCCLRAEFRTSHFEGKSATYNVLTKHSVMCFVRCSHEIVE